MAGSRFEEVLAASADDLQAALDRAVSQQQALLGVATWRSLELRSGLWVLGWAEQRDAQAAACALALAHDLAANGCGAFDGYRLLPCRLQGVSVTGTSAELLVAVGARYAARVQVDLVPPEDVVGTAYSAVDAVADHLGELRAGAALVLRI